MKAVCISKFGGPDELGLRDLPEPVAGSGQAVVRVKSAALNHLDIWVRKGRPGLTLKDTHIMGSDLSGVVEAIGPECDNPALKVGDEVVLNPGVSCMVCEYCRRGLHSECPSFKLIGFQMQGVYAELAVVPARNLFPKPKNLNWDEAAALNLSHITAYRMLFERARLLSGETVLFHGIGGGAALAGMQFALAVGAEAIVTSSTGEKLARALDLGAKTIINYKTTPDIGAEVKAATNGRGVDVVFDTVGAGTLQSSFASLRRGGRIVTCGITTGALAEINLQQLYWNHFSLLGSTMGSMEDMRRMLRTVENAGIKPVIDRVLPSTEFREATSLMEDGAQFGKIVLRFS